MTASVSQASPRRRPRLRKDAERNRQRLLDAAGETFRDSPSDASMPEIARRAGVSAATAYRFFPSLEDLLNEYLFDVIVRLRDFSHDCVATGVQLFKEVVAEWVRLLQSHGRAMVQLRSREGFLRRLRQSDPVITAVRDAWERPIRGLMRADRIPDDLFDTALFLYNLMFDPREIVDLSDSGRTPEEIRCFLIAAYRAALCGWADAQVEKAPSAMGSMK